MINKIKIQITTGDVKNADTDGNVYLGICGREFYTDSSDDDFERGATRDYIFGVDSNIRNPAINDPRKPAIYLEDVDLFPVYIRFDGGGDSWLLWRAFLFINDAPFQNYETRVDNEGGLWMGKSSTQIFYLRKPLEVPYRDRT
jgi:hypothetical protein